MPIEALMTGYPVVSLNVAATAVVGTYFAVPPDIKDFAWSAILADTSVTALQVDIEGNNVDPAVAGDWFSLASTSVVGNASGKISQQYVRWIRANLVILTGTGTVTVTIIGVKNA